MTQGRLGAVFYCDFPYTDPILKGSLCLALPGRVVYYDKRTPGAVFYCDIPYTDLILKGNLRLTVSGRVVHYDTRTVKSNSYLLTPKESHFFLLLSAPAQSVTRTRQGDLF